MENTAVIGAVNKIFHRPIDRAYSVYCHLLEFDRKPRREENGHRLRGRILQQYSGEIPMKKCICLLAVMSIFAAVVFPQTPKYRYEFTKFVESFPNANGKARDTASVAGDGKGKILVLRRSDPPVLIYNRE